MYFYSKKSNRKVIHTLQCHYFVKMEHDKGAHFETLEEARKQGYHLCKHCAAMGKYYWKEQQEIKRFVENKNIVVTYFDGSIEVQTPYSNWKIITNGQKNYLFLYHKNVYKNAMSKSIVPGYHSQSFRRRSIMEYLEYIVEHDKYRVENPKFEATVSPEPHKGGKKHKKWEKKQRKHEKYASAMRVLALIENNTNYRSMTVSQG